MVKTFVIAPYSTKSKSAKALSIELGLPLIPKGYYDPSWTIINWGSGSKFASINKSEAVSNSIDKARTFQLLKGVARIPFFTTSIDEARKWFREGVTVVCRTTATGHGGKGIRIVSLQDGNTELDIPPCPLYTQYVPKDAEYRVHVAFGKVIDLRKKVREEDRPIVSDPRIHNHDNGYVFRKSGFEWPTDVMNQALVAIKALGLDFGAVDVVEYYGKAGILEVNTAPGLTGSTIKSYGDAFREHMTHVHA